MEGERNFEVGSGSTRTKVFPAGLRVLVVDDDPTCLMIIETMLRTCHYEVVAAGLAVLALKFLRDREGGFDLVLTDVHMPEMDGFQLLHCIRREFNDIPVIMMSVDDKFEVMTKGLESGACFYLVKPITFSEIQTLWQYAFHMRSDNNQRQPEGKRKAKESEEEEEEEEENEDKDDSTSQKKVRMAWNADLHQQFLDAIEQLGGFDNAVPVRILKLMNVPGLTREQIASHLQKYRIFVRRMRGTPRTAVRGNPRYSQSPNLMPLQQGIRSRIRGVYASNCKPLAGPAQFINQGNLQQPWLSNPPLNQQNVSSYPTREMEQYDTRMGEPLHGDHDNSAVFVSDNETMQTVHQQTDQASLRPLGNGPDAPVDHNFIILNLPGENNALVGGNTGIGMESFGDESSKCNNLTYNQMDEGHMGNMNVAATRDGSPVLDFNGIDFDFTTQEIGSSSVFPSENQSPTMFSNVIEQLEQPSSLPPPDLQQLQGGEDVDHFMDMLMSMCTHANEHNSLPQTFVEGNLGNSIFNEIDEATYQQQQEGNEQVMDTKFDVSGAHQLDDDDSSK